MKVGDQVLCKGSTYPELKDKTRYISKVGNIAIQLSGMGGNVWYFKTDFINLTEKYQAGKKVICKGELYPQYKFHTFTIEEANIDKDIIRFKERNNWFAIFDFYYGPEFPDASLSIREVAKDQRVVASKIDKWIGIDINLSDIPKEGINDPEVRELLSNIIRSTIKLRYPETRPFAIRIEDIKLSYEVSNYYIKAKYRVLKTRIFKR